jgi:hypothetical protein
MYGMYIAPPFHFSRLDNLIYESAKGILILAFVDLAY